MTTLQIILAQSPSFDAPAIHRSMDSGQQFVILIAIIAIAVFAAYRLTRSVKATCTFIIFSVVWTILFAIAFTLIRGTPYTVREVIYSAILNHKSGACHIAPLHIMLGLLVGVIAARTTYKRANKTNSNDRNA